MQKCIHYSIKHLWWSFLWKLLKAFQSLTIAKKSCTFDVWLDFEYNSEMPIYVKLMLNIILSIAKIQHIQHIQTLEATHYIKKQLLMSSFCALQIPCCCFRPNNGLSLQLFFLKLFKNSNNIFFCFSFCQSIIWGKPSSNELFQISLFFN